MTKPSGNKIGRPKKSDLAAVRENRSVGRPKGTAAIINEYRDRMLNSPKSEKVLQKIMDAALQDEHPQPFVMVAAQEPVLLTTREELPQKLGPRLPVIHQAIRPFVIRRSPPQIAEIPVVPCMDPDLGLKVA